MTGKGRSGSQTQARRIIIVNLIAFIFSSYILVQIYEADQVEVNVTNCCLFLLSGKC